MYRTESAELNRYIAWGLILSLLVHVIMVAVLAKKPPQQFDTPVFVDIIEDTTQSKTVVKKQLVSTPQIEPAREPPLDSRYESEKDISVPKEQLKRGDNLAAPVVGPDGPPVPKSASSPKTEPQKKVPTEKKEAPSQKPPEKHLDTKSLRLDSETLQNQFALRAETKKDENLLDRNTTTSISNYAPFSRPYGSGARFLGAQGESDYLPSLPDGDITLLNTKANQFAVFVRRVATQVFAQMRTDGWDLLRGTDIRAATNQATVRAILSPQGDLISVTIENNSGSVRFDKLLAASAQKGARDRNPPVGARASDGNIHFIFESKSWVEIVAEPRTGMPIERRWLLLGTGLE